MELVSHQKVGSSLVAERKDLLEFLGRALDAEDLGALMTLLRKMPPKPARRKLRIFKPVDLESGSLRTTPLGVHLLRGRVELHFDNLEELATQMWWMATVIETIEFERRTCRPPAPSAAAEAAQRDLDALYGDLEEEERAYAARMLRQSQQES